MPSTITEHGRGRQAWAMLLAAAVACGVGAAADAGASTPPGDVARWVAEFDWTRFVMQSCGSSSPSLVIDGVGVDADAAALPAPARVQSVVPVDSSAGTALVFEECSSASYVHQYVSLVRVTGNASTETIDGVLVDQGRTISVALPEFVVEFPGFDDEGTLHDPDWIGRARYTVAGGEITLVAAEHQLPLEQATPPDVNPLPPLDLRGAVAALPPASACFPWSGEPIRLDMVSGAIDLVDGSGVFNGEIEAMRLALIRLTGMWIEPANEVHDDYAAAIVAYQQQRGLEPDGLAGPDTQAAIRADLGCPEPPPWLWTRVGEAPATTPPSVVAAVETWLADGVSGVPALDVALAESGSRDPSTRLVRCGGVEGGYECVWSGVGAFAVTMSPTPPDWTSYLLVGVSRIGDSAPASPAAPSADAACPGLALFGSGWDDFDGMTGEGDLVRQVQQRLVDLGYGESIIASGGVDGYFGPGTLDALIIWLETQVPANELADYIRTDEGAPIAVTSAVLPLLGVSC